MKWDLRWLLGSLRVFLSVKGNKGKDNDTGDRQRWQRRWQRPARRRQWMGWVGRGPRGCSAAGWARGLGGARGVPRPAPEDSRCRHSPPVQFWESSRAPLQSRPPFWGGGATHSRLRQWAHSVPQADHLLHSVHAPSTAGAQHTHVGAHVHAWAHANAHSRAQSTTAHHTGRRGRPCHVHAAPDPRTATRPGGHSEPTSNHDVTHADAAQRVSAHTRLQTQPGDTTLLTQTRNHGGPTARQTWTDTRRERVRASSPRVLRAEGRGQDRRCNPCSEPLPPCLQPPRDEQAARGRSACPSLPAGRGPWAEHPAVPRTGGDRLSSLASTTAPKSGLGARHGPGQGPYLGTRWCRKSSGWPGPHRRLLR